MVPIKVLPFFFLLLGGLPSRILRCLRVLFERDVVVAFLRERRNAEHPEILVAIFRVDFARPHGLEEKHGRIVFRRYARSETLIQGGDVVHVAVLAQGLGDVRRLLGDRDVDVGFLGRRDPGAAAGGAGCLGCSCAAARFTHASNAAIAITQTVIRFIFFSLIVRGIAVLKCDNRR